MSALRRWPSCHQSAPTACLSPLVVPVPSPTLLTCASGVTLAPVQDQERLGARYVGHDDAGNWAAGEPLSSWVLGLLAVGGEGGASSVSVQLSKYCHQNVVPVCRCLLRWTHITSVQTVASTSQKLGSCDALHWKGEGSAAPQPFSPQAMGDAL